MEATKETSTTKLCFNSIEEEKAYLSTIPIPDELISLAKTVLRTRIRCKEGCVVFDGEGDYYCTLDIYPKERKKVYHFYQKGAPTICKMEVTYCKGWDGRINVLNRSLYQTYEGLAFLRYIDDKFFPCYDMGEYIFPVPSDWLG